MFPGFRENVSKPLIKTDVSALPFEKNTASSVKRPYFTHSRSDFTIIAGKTFRTKNSETTPLKLTKNPKDTKPLHKTSQKTSTQQDVNSTLALPDSSHVDPKYNEPFQIRTLPSYSAIPAVGSLVKSEMTVSTVPTQLKGKGKHNPHKTENDINPSKSEDELHPRIIQGTKRTILVRNPFSKSNKTLNSIKRKDNAAQTTASFSLKDQRLHLNERLSPKKISPLKKTPNKVHSNPDTKQKYPQTNPTGVVLLARRDKPEDPKVLEYKKRVQELERKKLTALREMNLYSSNNKTSHIIHPSSIPQSDETQYKPGSLFKQYRVYNHNNQSKLCVSSKPQTNTEDSGNKHKQDSRNQSNW